MDYTHLPRKIQNPYWGNNEKTQIICEFNYEGGPVLTASVSDTDNGNPDWKEILDTFTLEEIDKITKDYLKQELVDHEKRKEFEKDEIERMKSDSLFNAKLEAFDIEDIKNSKNRKFKSRIRKAKNIMEVTALTTALIILENEE